MNANTEQILEASRYYNADTKTECYVCGEGTTREGGFCRACHVPYDVSASAASRGVEPSFVPILGASGAGKTVYIGMLLDILAKGSADMCGVSNNAFSVTVQQQTVAALERRSFPEKTACEAEEWQWVHCEVTSGKRSIDIVTPDLAGEAVAMELAHPNSFPAVRSCVQNASGMILLIDALNARDGGSDEDLFATKLATFVHQHSTRPGGRQKKSKLPLAITFTKSDTCPEADLDPAGFADHNLPSLMACADHYFHKVQFFAASAVGSSANISTGNGKWQLPLHVQPKGILEPLMWLMKA